MYRVIFSLPTAWPSWKEKLLVMTLVFCALLELLSPCSFSNGSRGSERSCSVHVGHASRYQIDVISHLIWLGTSLLPVEDGCLQNRQVLVSFIESSCRITYVAANRSDWVKSGTSTESTTLWSNCFSIAECPDEDNSVGQGIGFYQAV